VNTSQPFNQFLRSRRSIRDFTNQPISDEILREILETATYAPSAHGMQPWRFALVESQTARNALGAALTAQMQTDMAAENAPETEIRQRVERSLARLAAAVKIVVLCQDGRTVRVQSPEESQMGAQSLAMAGLQLMLAAHARGIGSVWVCWPLYAPHETQQALRLPQSWLPQGMVFLGYPARQAQSKTLKPLEEVLRVI